MVLDRSVDLPAILIYYDADKIMQYADQVKMTFGFDTAFKYCFVKIGYHTGSFTEPVSEKAVQPIYFAGQIG